MDSPRNVGAGDPQLHEDVLGDVLGQGAVLHEPFRKEVDAHVIPQKENPVGILIP